MRGIASRAVAKALALAAAFAFALCVFVVAGSAQSAYAEWDNSHEHYYQGETMVTDDILYISEDGAWYYFDQNGLVGTGWNYYDWDEPAYCYGDPTTGKLKFGWQKIGGYWYYFAKNTGWSDDGNGYYRIGGMYGHGVAKVNGKWYYFANSDYPAKWGKMQYKWIKEVDSSGEVIWYYADPNKDGQLATGWKKIDGKWYYFEPSETGAEYDDSYYVYGQMHYGGVEVIKGNPYYFAKGGALQSGWIKEPYRSGTYSDGSYQKWNDWYYADPNNDSRLVKGWKKISGYWYYFGGDYEMYDNDTWTISGKLYIFDRSGKLAWKAGWFNLYEEYFYEDGSESQTVPYWTYSNSSGIATVGWKKISGYWYYFGEWGYMEHDEWIEDSKGACYLQGNGKMAVSQWVKYDGNWYYVDASGHKLTGAQNINGKTYVFNDDGILIS